MKLIVDVFEKMGIGRLLFIGAVLALMVAQTGLFEVYEKVLSYHLIEWGIKIGHYHNGHYIVDLLYVVNEILMPLFFFVAGKEVFEAMVLKKGSLNTAKKAALPMVATLGGIMGPVLIYFVGITLMGRFYELWMGAAIPIATDIAFSFMVACLLFGKDHPAVTFLLALAIVDDAIGLFVLAIVRFNQMVPGWILLVGVAMYCAYTLHQKKCMNPWWYFGVMCISWLGMALSGIHPVLCSLPIIPFIPHADSDLSMEFFNEEEAKLKNPLSQLEHKLEMPVFITLGLFGFANAGVPFGEVSTLTFVVLAALLIGKPLGICALSYAGIRYANLRLPEGMEVRHLIVVGKAAGIGFTVSLFMATVVFPLGSVLSSAKMGALCSLGAIGTSWLAHYVLFRKERVVSGPNTPEARTA